MTDFNIRQNKISATPRLKDLLDLHKKDIFLNLNCHAIGTVQSFNSTLQTAEITINYAKTYFKNDKPTLINYPVLMDCPVIVMQGGPGSLTMPIAAGDTCMVLFNDRDMDTWVTSGTVSNPVSTPRLHSFADGVVLIGIRHFKNPIASYDATRASLNNGTASVGVGPTLIRIKNPSTSLGVQLANLTTDLTNLTTQLTTLTAALITAFGSPTPAVGVTLNPAAVTAITAVQTSVGTIQTAISGVHTALGGLLE